MASIEKIRGSCEKAQILSVSFAEAREFKKALREIVNTCLDLLDRYESALREWGEDVDRLTAERDAAVKDINDFYTLPVSCACDFCKYAIVSPEPQECIDCIGGLRPRSKFEWRGVAVDAPPPMLDAAYDYRGAEPPNGGCMMHKITDEILGSLIGDQIALRAYRAAAPLEKVREWAKAELEERLQILPCRVSDNIFWVGAYRGKNQVVMYRVEDITVYKSGWLVSCGRTLQFYKSDMGRTWFLTREEAEAALDAQKGER